MPRWREEQSWTWGSLRMLPKTTLSTTCRWRWLWRSRRMMRMISTGSDSESDVGEDGDSDEAEGALGGRRPQLLILLEEGCGNGWRGLARLSGNRADTRRPLRR
eukprot:1121887-Rhodomonas_salina.3